ncbi:MAG TPA: hypothetical protein VIO36_12730 [Anaerolineaceae bacterium]
MTTPAQFEHRLAEMNIDTLTGSEALQAAEDELRLMEQDIQREIRVIQLQYQSRITGANRGGSSQVLVSNRQAASERRRADQVEKLEAERDGKVQPYQQVLDAVVERLRALESKRGSA